MARPRTPQSTKNTARANIRKVRDWLGPSYKLQDLAEILGIGANHVGQCALGHDYIKQELARRRLQALLDVAEGAIRESRSGELASVSLPLKSAEIEMSGPDLEMWVKRKEKTFMVELRLPSSRKKTVQKAGTNKETHES